MLITGNDSVSLNVYFYRNGKRRGELKGKRLLQPHRDHLGDAGVFHGDAVEGVGHGHGGLGVMGDEDEPGEGGHLPVVLCRVRQGITTTNARPAPPAHFSMSICSIVSSTDPGVGWDDGFSTTGMRGCTASSLLPPVPRASLVARSAIASAYMSCITPLISA